MRDDTLDYPATRRNQDAILEVLREHLPARGGVLEVASGSGQHAVAFARGLPALRWQPSSPEAAELRSIEAYRQLAGLPNLAPPILLDVEVDPWPIAEADALVCINMLHIAPWTAAVALFSGAARLLPLGAPMITYGPYRFSGVFTAPSNESFDRSLRHQDDRWGVRDTDDLDDLASTVGFSREHTIALPANNHVLVWRRSER